MKQIVEWTGDRISCSRCTEPAVAMYIESGPWQPTELVRHPSQMSAAALESGAVEEELPAFPPREGYPFDDLSTGWKQSSGQGTFLCLDHARQELERFA
jgi:hypothetical protein